MSEWMVELTAGVLQLGLRYKLRNAVFALVLMNAYSVARLIILKQYY